MMRRFQFGLTMAWMGWIHLVGQGTVARIESIPNFEGWGWTAVVQTNGFITAATVPAIGARIMAFRLGTFESIYRNPSLYGKTFAPRRGSWYNFGGYKMWPAPQAAWNWPPPPTLDYGAYEADIVHHGPDSTTLWVRSPVEQWLAPGIRFERLTTLYRGSSRFRVRQTLRNEGDQTVRWGIWDVTQKIVHHEGQSDHEWFWVYFPLNPQSRFGPAGFRWGGFWGVPSRIRHGEVAPGIFGLQYQREEAKVFADSPKGWIAYADEKEGVIFVKTFPIDETAEYPDDGARVEVYTTGNGTYLEVETLGPLVTLSPGEETTLVEVWAATRGNGPVLDVGPAGLVTRHLSYDSNRGRFIGRYGVFDQGTAWVLLVPSGGGDPLVLQHFPVTPFEPVEVDLDPAIPEIVGSIVIRIEDERGVIQGDLEQVPTHTLSKVHHQQGVAGTTFLLDPYPNPFNPSTRILFTVDAPQKVRLAVYDIRGRQVACLVNGPIEAGLHERLWDATGLAGGVYLIRLETSSGVFNRKAIRLP